MPRPPAEGWASQGAGIASRVVAGTIPPPAILSHVDNGDSHGPPPHPPTRAQALRSSQEGQVHKIPGQRGPLARSRPPPEGEEGCQERRRRSGRPEAPEK